MTTFPRVGCYCSLRNSDTVLGDGRGNPNAENIAKLARWSDVVLDLGPAIEQPRIIEALRAANPGIRLHAYVPMKAYDWGGAYYQDLLWTVGSIKGFLYRQSSDEMWDPTNINVARPDVVEAVAQCIARHLRVLAWDGLFLDVNVPQIFDQWAAEIDWRRAGFDSAPMFQSAWMAGHVVLVETIRRETRSDLIVTTNPPFSHADVNGQMRESFPTLHLGPGDDPWYANMVENYWHQPGLLRETFREPRASWLCSEPYRYGSMRLPFNHLDSENQRRHRYGLASACLGGAFHSFGRYEGDPEWCARGRLDFWYPEYSHPQRGRGWLGEPMAMPFHVTMEGGKRVELWTRTFEHGIVVVNPSAQPHSIYFQNRYREIGGAAKTGWSIPPYDALIAESV